MWVAAFLTCTGPMAYECTLGVKTDRLFVEQDTCSEYADYAKAKLEDLGAVVVGHCFRIQGETL